MRETTEIEIVFGEVGTYTEARASLVIRDTRFTSSGRASRSPADADLPIVGEELAAARALADLAHQLVEAATKAISERGELPQAW